MKPHGIPSFPPSAPALLCAICLLLPSGLAAAEGEFPHAFPRTGVTQLFDNERVTAWNVNWIRDVEQPYHRHRYDMAGVYLRFGPIQVTALDGSVSPQRPPFDIPRPYFQEAGVTHKEEMIGFAPDAPERWAIMFDLKPLPAAPATPKPDLPPAFPRAGAEMAIDNNRVTEWVHGWEPGQALARHVHDKDSVQVFYAPGTISFTDEAGNVTSQSFAIGDARFIAAGTVDMEEATSGNPKAVTIELK